MDLPPSSLLGRLEAFLPEMEKANQTTEKLAQQGKLEVLDSNLEVAGTDQQREEEEEEEADGDDAAEGVEQEEDGAEPGAGPPTRTVQLVSAGVCVCIVYLHVARGMKYKRVQHGAKCFFQRVNTRWISPPALLRLLLRTLPLETSTTPR